MRTSRTYSTWIKKFKPIERNLEMNNKKEQGRAIYELASQYGLFKKRIGGILKEIKDQKPKRKMK